MKPLVLLEEAERDILTATRWYDGLAPGLGDAFLWRLEEAIQRLRSYPEIYQVVFDDVRRVALRRFCHGMFYRLLPNEIEVVGVQHERGDTIAMKHRGGTS